MEEILKPITERDEPAGSIVRVIDGVTYTVLIHFNPNSKETSRDKIKRLIKTEVQNENFGA